VVLVDCLSYLLAGSLALIVQFPHQKKRLPNGYAHMAKGSGLSFQKEWRDGIAMIARSHILTMLLVIMGITTFGGAMMDPLFAPFVFEVLLGNAAQFGCILTIQGLGGLVGGLFIGRFARHMKPASLFGLSSIVSGVVLFVLFHSTSIVFVMMLGFFLGMVSVGSRVGTQTLMQLTTTDENRGRVFGTGAMVGSGLELSSVSFAGIAAQHLGIVPILSLASGITFLAGVLAMLLFKDSKLGSRVL
jgi:predicted MFS family arabinose efflux permease